MVKKLWVEAYRPKTLDAYVFKDATQKATIQNWIKEGSIPHLILHGGAGTGKTTLARVLAAELGIEDSDFMYINASRDNGVDLIRDRITRFASSMPWGEFKIILLDEADYISPAGQAALRGVMEEYADVVRFILTCNYPARIIDAIKSRSQSFNISNQDQTDFTTRVAEILLAEGVEFELETLDNYVKATYPDLRKTINTVEQNVVDGKLEHATQTDDISTEWKLKMIALFRDGKIRAARELICANATMEDFDDMYRFLFNNIEFFGEDQDTQDAAVVIIRNGKYKSQLVGDQEIAFSATVIELEQLSRT